MWITVLFAFMIFYSFWLLAFVFIILFAVAIIGMLHATL